MLEHARRFAERGCRVHLLGTYITPLLNWQFLCNRMASGAAFGRYISKAQAVDSLRRYHSHFDAILAERHKRAPPRPLRVAKAVAETDAELTLPLPSLLARFDATSIAEGRSRAHLPPS